MGLTITIPFISSASQLVCCGAYTRTRASCPTVSWSLWTSWRTTSLTCPKKLVRNWMLMCRPSCSSGHMEGRSTTLNTSLTSLELLVSSVCYCYCYDLCRHAEDIVASRCRSNVMDSPWVIRGVCRPSVSDSFPTCVWWTTTAGPTAPSSSTMERRWQDLSCCHCRLISKWWIHFRKEILHSKWGYMW